MKCSTCGKGYNGGVTLTMLDATWYYCSSICAFKSGHSDPVKEAMIKYFIAKHEATKNTEKQEEIQGMMVTNEQAEKIKALCKSTNNTNCYGCQYSDDKYDFCPSTWDAPQLAADLLDSRETIEKQEATIKEMRKALSYIDCLNVNPSTTELSNTTRWSLASNKVKAILEKTKDYAE